MLESRPADGRNRTKTIVSGDHCIDSSIEDLSPRLEAEVTLLVEGLLGDPKVFQSFGYEYLYEHGYSTLEHWEVLQRSKVSTNIDKLDNAFSATDKAKANLHSYLGLQRSFLCVFSTHFNLAARDGCEEIVTAFLNRGCNPDETNPWSYLGTPLVEAIKNSHQRVVKLLLHRGANANGAAVEQFPQESDSPLMLAINQGQSDIITQLLEYEAEPSILLRFNYNDQWWAADVLIDLGVNPNVILNMVCRFGHVEKRLLLILLDWGADIASLQTLWAGTWDKQAHQAFDLAVYAAESLRYHNTGMINAIQSGKLTAVETEVEHGADPTFGLAAAQAGGHTKILEMLLNRGANPRYL